MGVAICAQAGRFTLACSTKPGRIESIIGFGGLSAATRHQYIGATFTFDNTGVFKRFSDFP
jgi:hypothetical protein